MFPRTTINFISDRHAIKTDACIVVLIDCLSHAYPCTILFLSRPPHAQTACRFDRDYYTLLAYTVSGQKQRRGGSDYTPAFTCTL